MSGREAAWSSRRWIAARRLPSSCARTIRARRRSRGIAKISRIVYERCASCHREGGTSFSLMTYQDAQPHASAIKDAVLSRRMPPWGAVKGFGNFRNDQGLTQEQIALVTDWVEGGITRGNNPNALPPVPKFDSRPPVHSSRRTRSPSPASLTLDRARDARRPVSRARARRRVDADRRGAARTATSSRWSGCTSTRTRYRHPFLFRKPLALPAGTRHPRRPRRMPGSC